MLLRCLLLFVVCSIPAAAGGVINIGGKSIDDYTIRVAARGWLAALDGSAEVDEDDFDGTHVDLDDDLDLGRDHFAAEFLVEVRVWKLRFQARYFQQEYEADEVISKSFTYKGTTYSTFDDVESEITLRSGGIDAEFLILDIGSHKEIGFELGLGLGARYLYAEGAVKRDPGGPRERKDSDAIIPVARVSASLGFVNIFALEFDVEAMKIGYHDINAQFLDATAQVKVFLHEYVAIGVGYRYVALELEERKSGDDFDIELRVSGFFAELSVQF